MVRYEVVYRPSIAKDLRKLPRDDIGRILARAEALRDDPRPPGFKKLTGQQRYRIRQGDYRILYTIADAVLIVEVVKIGHRSDIYREG